jgi:CheY-like chemotaxis protein
VTEKKRTIRVLIADDEAEVRSAYREVLSEADMSGETAVFRNLRERLFTKPAADQVARALASPSTTFAPVFCAGAEAAVAAVRDALAAEEPFAVAFLDMRMPPGPDGVWAAARIRELDPAIEIVLCTAYSDVDPAEMGSIVPPEEKLSYLQKPFHPHEIRQMTISLASKWRSEHRIVRLAYFDGLTGLPNREQSRNRLASALAAQRSTAVPSRFFTWIWIISSGSTTPWVTRWATSFSARSPRGCAIRSARTAGPRPTSILARARTILRGSAVMNSS